MSRLLAAAPIFGAILPLKPFPRGMIRISVKMRFLVCGLLSFACGLSVFLISSSAFAVACRDIPSVRESAVLNNNAKMGGHVAAHIHGFPNPPIPQEGKTLFDDQGKYEQSWGWYTRQINNPVNCSGNQAQQEFDLQPGHFIAALSCKAVDKNNGQCTQFLHYAASKVFVGFVFKNGKWILNTAFPEPISP